MYESLAFTGDGTAYTLSTPSVGNCNFMAWPSAATTNYAAINNAQWNNGLECGRCAKVSCIDPACTSKSSAIVHIVDRCPECATGALDVSQNVFKTITGLAPNRLKIEWGFVDCPNANTKPKMCLKAGSNPYWTAIQPTLMQNGVKSMSINGLPATQLGDAYYFKVENSKGIDLNNVQLSMTSSAGQVYTQNVPLTAGNCVDTILQSATPSSKASLMSIDSPVSTEPAAKVSNDITNSLPSNTSTKESTSTPPSNAIRTPFSTPPFHVMSIGESLTVTEPSKNNGAIDKSKSASKSVAFSSNVSSKSSSLPMVAAIAGVVAAVCVLALTVYSVRKRSRTARTPRLPGKDRNGKVAIEAAAVDLSTRGNYKSHIAIL